MRNLCKQENKELSFPTPWICKQKLYLQLVYLSVWAELQSWLVHLLSAFFSQQLLVNASLQDEAAAWALTFSVLQKAINGSSWFCWGLFLDAEKAPSPPGWLCFQQPVCLSQALSRGSSRRSSAGFTRAPLLKSRILTPPLQEAKESYGGGPAGNRCLYAII